MKKRLDFSFYGGIILLSRNTANRHKSDKSQNKQEEVLIMETQTKTIQRKDYMSGKVSHREYYAQFVNDEVKQMVISFWGMEAIKVSKDEHLNDMPLRKWDSLTGFIFSNGNMICKPSNIRPVSIEKIREVGESLSSSTLVCIYKEACKQIKEAV